MTDEVPRAAPASAAPAGPLRAPLAPDATAALDWLFDHGFLGGHATAAVIGLVVDGESLLLVGAVGDLPPLPRHDPPALPLSADLPLCRAAALGECTGMATAAEIRSRSPWLAVFAPAARAAITVPIRAGGRLIGAIGVTYSVELPGTGDLSARLREIADSLGASLRVPADRLSAEVRSPVPS